MCCRRIGEQERLEGIYYGSRSGEKSKENNLPHGHGGKETKHRFYGVSVFKRGFCGQEVAYLHAHDLVINRSGYLIDLIIETARKHIRHI